MTGLDLTPPAAPGLGRLGAVAARVGDRRVTVFLLGALPVVALGAANGGYYEGSWNWASLLLLWLAGLTFLAGLEASLTRLSVAFAALTVAVLIWTLASALWSSDRTVTGLATERQLLYAACVLAGVAVVRRSTIPALVTGLWCGIVLICGYGLLTRLLPDHLGIIDPIAGNRLSGPIGYWNSFGLLAATGLLLALGLAARARPLAVRLLAAASAPVLASALYFTFSRGAWLALAIGLVVAVAIDRAPLQLAAYGIALAAPAAASVELAATKAALTTSDAALAPMTDAGHRLFVEVAVLMLAAAVAAVPLVWLEGRLTISPAVRRATRALFAAVAVAGIVVFVVRLGTPWAVGERAWHSFAAQPVASGSDLNARLFHLSSTGRVTQWRVAWDQVQAHPWLGGGAGTWAAYWAAHRPYPSIVQNVHNLYLEELSELGPVGLALLAAALAVPLAGLRAARREPFAAVALGVYAAFLAHAAVDWDWQLPAVTVPALLCGVALVAAARAHLVPATRAVRRVPILLAVGVLLAAAVYGAIGRVAVSRVDSAAHAGRWDDAEVRARHAATLEPWSDEAWKHLADIALVSHNLPLARTAFLQALVRGPNDGKLWLGLAQASSGPLHSIAVARAAALDPLDPAVTALRASH